MFDVAGVLHKERRKNEDGRLGVDPTGPRRRRRFRLSQLTIPFRSQDRRVIPGFDVETEWLMDDFTLSSSSLLY